MKKMMSKLVKVVTALSMAASIIPGTMINTAAARIETVDLLLNDDGTVRDGVKISAHWKKKIVDENKEVIGYSDEEETDGWDVVLTNTGTERGEKNQGKYHGWDGMVFGSGYIQLDLGEVSDISKIEFAPYINDNRDWYFGYKYAVSISNTLDFSDSVPITENITFSTEAEADGTYKLTAFTPNNDNTWQCRYIRFSTTSTIDDIPIGASKIKVTGTKTYVPQNLLTNDDGTLRAELSSSHGGYEGEDGNLKDINNICDGKYEIVYGEDGKIDFDKASSFVSGWNGDKAEWVKIDLKEVKSIESVKVLLYPGTYDSDNPDFWYFRDSVSIQASNNPNFNTFKTLATTTKEHQTDKNKWLEYTTKDYKDEYRYIRIYSPNQKVIGITEVQVEGYDLCSSVLCYTNIDDAIMADSNDGTKPKVSNVSNANVKVSSFVPNFCVVDDRIQLVFSGDVDASTVNSDTIKMTQSYTQYGSTTEAKAVTYTPAVDGNTVYIDPKCFKAYANVTVEITSDVIVNGMNVTPTTLLFKTGDIAPLEYTAGKVIKNVAAGKTVIASESEITDRFARPMDQNYNYLVDLGLMGGSGNSSHYILIDLGNDYDVRAFGMDADNAFWHITRRDIYMSDSFDKITDELSIVQKNTNNDAIFGALSHARKALTEPKTARYILIHNNKSDAELLYEFSAYAYAPETTGGITDAYFKRILQEADDGNGYVVKNVHFYTEGELPEGTTVVIAGYKDGKLETVNATAEDKVISIPVEYAKNGTVKAFIWDGLSAMKPIIPAAEF